MLKPTPRRLGLGFALAAIAALYLLTWPFSLMTFDLSRDVAIASSIARGEAWPMQGPILAGAIHAGPLWYYLLALPLAFVSSVLPALLFVGFLAALKIPLAYLIGARFIDRPTGFLWALMLILPGWNTFEGILVLHPSLVATCTLAFVWFALLYARDGGRRHLALAGLAFALALHAHPSTYGLVVPLLCAVVYRHRLAKSPLRTYAWLVLGVAAPFVPYIAFQASIGFPDWTAATNYLANSRNLGSIQSVPEVLVGLFATGPTTIIDAFADNPGMSSWLLRGTYALLYIVAAAGLVISLVGGRRRLAIAGMASAVLVVLISVVAIRVDTPFHMTYVVWVFAAGLLALGLRGWLDFRVGRPLAILAIAVSGMGTVVLQTQVATSIERGTYGFTLLPLFDIKQPIAHGAPMPFVPAHALAASGQRLCAAPGVTAHGAYAVHLLHGYAIEAQLECGDTTHIRLGGAGAADTAHWVGVSRQLAVATGVPITAWLGPVGMKSAARVVHPAIGVRVPTQQQYPPATDLNGPAQRYSLDFLAAGDEVVLVTNVYFTFSPNPEVVALANGVPVVATSRDQVSAAYVCARCTSDAPVHWHLDVAAPAFDRIDIVTISKREPS